MASVTPRFLATHCCNWSGRGVYNIAGYSTVQWRNYSTPVQMVGYDSNKTSMLGLLPGVQLHKTHLLHSSKLWKSNRSNRKYHTHHKEGPELEIQPDTFNSPEKTKKFVGKLRKKQRNLLLEELQTIQNREQNITNQDDSTLLRPPTRKQLNLVILNNAVPFIGFGFLDNAIMIIAGDYIDWRIGAVLGISTLAAAGLGNLISDLAGVVLAGYVEAFAERLGLQPPNLSLEQYDMRASKIAAAVGRCMGIAVGCLLGMFPLLFLNTEPRSPRDDDS